MALLLRLYLEISRLVDLLVQAAALLLAESLLVVRVSQVFFKLMPLQVQPQSGNLIVSIQEVKLLLYLKIMEPNTILLRPTPTL